MTIDEYKTAIMLTLEKCRFNDRSADETSYFTEMKIPFHEFASKHRMYSIEKTFDVDISNVSVAFSGYSLDVYGDNQLYQHKIREKRFDTLEECYEFIFNDSRKI